LDRKAARVSDLELAEAMDYCDSDHDGYLEHDDLYTLMINLNMKIYPALVREIWAEFRNIETNKIDFNNFKKAISKLKPQIATLI
jgi:Ca2+-binding EF-hand superfamily protein